MLETIGNKMELNTTETRALLWVRICHIEISRRHRACSIWEYFREVNPRVPLGERSLPLDASGGDHAIS